MTQALTASLRDPAQCLTFIGEVTGRLSRAGVTIKYVDFPRGELSEWHAGSRTFCLASDATLEDQVWACTELMLLLVVGPDACTGAHITPLLQVVPVQQAPSCDQKQPG